MALTTRAIVLQRLGLTDDSTSDGGMSIANSTTSGQVTYAKSGNTVTITRASGGATNFDISSASYDTITELAAGITALTGVSAAATDATIGALASSLLSTETVVIANPSADDEPNISVIPYTNTASGTTAALIDRLILESDAAIGRYCNQYDSTGAQTFESSSRTEVYDGDGSPMIVLRSRPVSSITSVKYIDGAGTVLSTLASTDYALDGLHGLLYFGGAQWIGGSWGDPEDATGWPAGFQNIQVIYTGGYSTVPYDLAGVATDVVVEMFLNRRTNAALSSMGGGPVNVGYLSADELTRKHQGRLAQYRRIAL